MREIKFRAWDDDKKEWWKELILVRAMDGKCMTVFESYEPPQECDFILSQYTGLKDKNNREIYEGDRLYYAGLRGTVVYDGNTCSFRVKSDGAQTVKFQPLTKMVRQQLEIIGNIYENPELLEAK